jgi:hypothetical protein
MADPSYHEESTEKRSAGNPKYVLGIYWHRDFMRSNG